MGLFNKLLSIQATLHQQNNLFYWFKDTLCDAITYT